MEKSVERTQRTFIRLLFGILLGLVLLIAAIWGVFIWKEFRAAPPGTHALIAIMFAGYACGLALIGMATL